jgi:hypothetical protein
MDAGRHRLTAESERETSSPQPSLLCASIDASEKVDDRTSTGHGPVTGRDERLGPGPGVLTGLTPSRSNHAGGSPAPRPTEPERMVAPYQLVNASSPAPSLSSPSPPSDRSVYALAEEAPSWHARSKRTASRCTADRDSSPATGRTLTASGGKLRTSTGNPFGLRRTRALERVARSR